MSGFRSSHCSASGGRRADFPSRHSAARKWCWVRSRLVHRCGVRDGAEAVRLHKRAPHRLLQFTLLASTGPRPGRRGRAARRACSSPRNVGRAFLGDNWAIGRPLLLPGSRFGLAAHRRAHRRHGRLRVLLAASKQTLALRLILLVLSMLAGSVGVVVGAAGRGAARNVARRVRRDSSRGGCGFGAWQSPTSPATSERLA